MNLCGGGVWIGVVVSVLGACGKKAGNHADGGAGSGMTTGNNTYQQP